MIQNSPAIREMLPPLDAICFLGITLYNIRQVDLGFS